MGYRYDSPTRKALILLIAIIVVSLIGVGIKVVFFPVTTLDKSINIAYDVVGETLDAENAIYNYEWFKEQEAYIRTCLKNEEIAKEEWELFKDSLPEDREKWTREDKAEESSLRNSYYALQKLTNKAIEDYNAKSSMVNRTIFKDELPSNITRAFYAGKELTK